jgi:hypothetical protein
MTLRRRILSFIAANRSHSRTKLMMTATTMEPAAVEEVDRRVDRAVEHGSTSNRRANRGFGKSAPRLCFQEAH